MTVTWYGQSCIRIDTREAILAIDPFSKEIGLTPPRFQANLVLVTHNHTDHNNVATFPGEPRVIAGPGEYEMRGVSIRGIPSFHDRTRGRERGLNTIYRIEAEGMRLAHLGDFGEEAMREETLERLGDVDVLFVPVGGTYTIDADAAARVVNQIEPRLVIPMHYALADLKVKLDGVERFLAAYGAKDAERKEKLALRSRDLPTDGTKVIVLTAG